MRTTAKASDRPRQHNFKYDPFGRRIYESSSSGTSIYAYDGDNLVEETNTSGSVVARYSQGLHIDEPLAMLRSSTTRYYDADGLGSVTSLSNGAGALAQTYTYDSFGKQTASSGSLTNPFQYTATRIRQRNKPLLLPGVAKPLRSSRPKRKIGSVRNAKAA
jgi:hypothetical protein